MRLTFPKWKSPIALEMMVLDRPSNVFCTKKKLAPPPYHFYFRKSRKKDDFVSRFFAKRLHKTATDRIKNWISNICKTNVVPFLFFDIKGNKYKEGKTGQVSIEHQCKVRMLNRKLEPTTSSRFSFRRKKAIQFIAAQPHPPAPFQSVGVVGCPNEFAKTC